MYQPPDHTRRPQGRQGEAHRQGEAPRKGAPQARRTSPATMKPSWPGQYTSLTPPPQSQQKRWIQEKIPLRRWHGVVLLLLACVFAVLWSVQSARIHAREVSVVQSRDALTQSLQAMDELQRQVAFSATDAFIEQQARDRFGYIMPGEYRFQREEGLAPANGQ